MSKHEVRTHITILVSLTLKKHRFVNFRDVCAMNVTILFSAHCDVCNITSCRSLRPHGERTLFSSGIEFSLALPDDDSVVAVWWSVVGLFQSHHHSCHILARVFHFMAGAHLVVVVRGSRRCECVVCRCLCSCISDMSSSWCNACVCAFIFLRGKIVLRHPSTSTPRSIASLAIILQRNRFETTM